MVELINGDCMEHLIRMPDNYYSISVVDPPYGINAFQGTNRASCHMFRNKTENWDNAVPTKEYFDELKRVSVNQIIWGGNYFLDHLGNMRCYIVWDKLNPDRRFADCELAWTSFDKVARVIKLRPQTENKNDHGKIHPTQKPVALYRRLFHDYCKPGDRVLDTHLGSGSSAIAAFDAELDFTGIEIDKTYYDAALDRFNKHKSQLKIDFTPKAEQLTII